MEGILEDILSSNSLLVTVEVLNKYIPTNQSSLVTGFILTQTIDTKNWNALLRCLLRVAQNCELDLVCRQSAIIRFFQLASNIPTDCKPVHHTAELLKSASEEASRFVQIESKLTAVLIRRLNQAIGELSIKFRASELVFTLARIAREHREIIQEHVPLSDMSDEDLEIIEKYKVQDVKEVLKRLINACEVAVIFTDNRISLRVVIFNTLLYILRKRMYDKPELMDHLETNLKKYVQLFSERQLEQFLERYTHLCNEFERPFDKALLDLLSPTSAPVKTRGNRFFRKH